MTATVEKSDTSPIRRPTGVNGWLVVGGVLTIILVVSGAISVAAWLGYRTETQTQAYPGLIREFDIELGTGDLRVVAGAEDAVVVTRRLHWSFTKPTVHEVLEGQRLTITQSCRPSLAAGPNCGIDYTIGVPTGIRLRAHTDTGDIVVDGVRGTVELSTSTGDISITAAAGDLLLRTDTGSVTVTGAHSFHVDVSTDTGDITLGLAGAPDAVTASSDTGDVRITVPRGGLYHVQSEVGTGDASVTVQTSDASDRTITARTDTGDIGITYE